MREDVAAPGAISRILARPQHLVRSLGLQLFLWLFGVVLLASALSAYVNIRTTSEQWTQAVFQTARRTSELIKRSTRYSMLLNRKEDVQQAIHMIAKDTDVVEARIYDKHGAIAFSAKEGEIGRKVAPEAEACTVCHAQGREGDAAPETSPVRVLLAPDGSRILAVLSTIENESACYGASCHVHPEERAVLGVLDLRISMASSDAHLAETKKQTTAAAFVMALLTGAASAVFIYLVVRRPVRHLMAGTERIARGDLETHIDITPRNEMGQLALAFNRMTDDLNQARQENAEWSRTLEQKVVAKTQELSRAQRQIVHMEKMASLGKLAATVAHELNNPLSAILMYARLVALELKDSAIPREEREELCRYLGQVQTDAGRCGEVVRNLLLFARPSGGDFALHRINHIVERSLMLVRHHLEMTHARFESHLLATNDEIVCDADQLQQAFVALLVNAAEAMPDGGQLTVCVASENGWVRIDISDTGVSIPEEVLPHIFEPFFSTKEEQSGVGLGLAVVYGIVQRHGGKLRVKPAAGKGTTVSVWLPERPPDTGQGGALDAADTARRARSGDAEEFERG